MPYTNLYRIVPLAVRRSSLTPAKSLSGFHFFRRPARFYGGMRVANPYLGSAAWQTFIHRTNGETSS